MGAWGKRRLERAHEGRARIRKSLSMRTHICSRCGLILDRDENAALSILARGLAVAREQGH
jgi:transposase